jgi:hypothetical protein
MHLGARTSVRRQYQTGFTENDGGHGLRRRRKLAVPQSPEFGTGAGKAGDYHQEDSQGGDDGRGEGFRFAPQSANDRIDYESTRNEDEKQVDDSGPNALRGRRGAHLGPESAPTVERTEQQEACDSKDDNPTWNKPHPIARRQRAVVVCPTENGPSPEDRHDRHREDDHYGHRPSGDCTLHAETSIPPYRHSRVGSEEVTSLYQDANMTPDKVPSASRTPSGTRLGENSPIPRTLHLPFGNSTLLDF